MDIQQDATRLTDVNWHALLWSLRQHQQRSLLFSRPSKSSPEEIIERSEESDFHHSWHWWVRIYLIHAQFSQWSFCDGEFGLVRGRFQ